MLYVYTCEADSIVAKIGSEGLGSQSFALALVRCSTAGMDHSLWREAVSVVTGWRERCLALSRALIDMTLVKRF
eukprot:m.113544 g.113544  ORF g.113544 m.113544 type:complete len:74 (-) comp10808_c0_seq1:1582-1803(-)